MGNIYKYNNIEVLDECARRGYVNLVKAFVEGGAKVDAPLVVAAIQADHFEMVDFLLPKLLSFDDLGNLKMKHFEFDSIRPYDGQVNLTVIKLALAAAKTGNAKYGALFWDNEALFEIPGNVNERTSRFTDNEGRMGKLIVDDKLVMAAVTGGNLALFLSLLSRCPPPSNLFDFYLRCLNTSIYNVDEKMANYFYGKLQDLPGSFTENQRRLLEFNGSGMESAAPSLRLKSLQLFCSIFQVEMEKFWIYRSPMINCNEVFNFWNQRFPGWFEENVRPSYLARLICQEAKYDIFKWLLEEKGYILTDDDMKHLIGAYGLSPSVLRSGPTARDRAQRFMCIELAARCGYRWSLTAFQMAPCWASFDQLTYLSKYISDKGAPYEKDIVTSQLFFALFGDEFYVDPRTVSFLFDSFHVTIYPAALQNLFREICFLCNNLEILPLFLEKITAIMPEEIPKLKATFLESHFAKLIKSSGSLQYEFLPIKRRFRKHNFEKMMIWFAESGFESGKATAEILEKAEVGEETKSRVLSTSLSNSSFCSIS